MPVTPPRQCAEPDCQRLTHYRYCRAHRVGRGPTATNARHRLCLTLSEVASLCAQLSTKGVQARAELTESGIALHFDGGDGAPRRHDVGFAQLIAIAAADETTELMQSVLRSFAEDERRSRGSAAA